MHWFITVARPARSSIPSVSVLGFSTRLLAPCKPVSSDCNSNPHCPLRPGPLFPAFPPAQLSSTSTSTLTRARCRACFELGRCFCFKQFFFIFIFKCMHDGQNWTRKLDLVLLAAASFDDCLSHNANRTITCPRRACATVS